MDKNKYVLEMDQLYFDLSNFINQPIPIIKNFDDDLIYIHITLNKISEQIGLFNQNRIKYYNQLTYFILECYNLLYKITSAIEPEIKSKLLSKSLQVFNTYTDLMDDPVARQRIQNLKGSKNKVIKNKRATDILLPRIVAMYLTKNNDFMKHDFLYSALFQVKQSKGLIHFKDSIITYLKANQNNIKIDRDVVNNVKQLNNTVYEIYEIFFNEIKRLHEEKVKISDDWLDGNYGYDKFNGYNKFSEYKKAFNPQKNVIFKSIKYIIKQSVII